MDAYGECRDSERKAQRFSAGRSRACRHGELRRLSTMSCCVLARKQIEVYMDAYGECRDNLIHLFYAAMAELADAADLGSVGQPPCRFKSC